MLNGSVGLDVVALNMDRARSTDGAQIVAHQVHEHPVFSGFFLVFHQGTAERLLFQCVASARVGALDGGGHRLTGMNRRSDSGELDSK